MEALGVLVAKLLALGVLSAFFYWCGHRDGKRLSKAELERIVEISDQVRADLLLVGRQCRVTIEKREWGLPKETLVDSTIADIQRNSRQSRSWSYLVKVAAETIDVGVTFRW